MYIVVESVCCFRSCRVFPGRWIGPWTGCRALEAAAAAAAAAAGGGGSDGAMDNPSLPSNLAFKVCGEFGGGAPLLPRDEFLPFFENVSDDNRRGENNSRNENGLVLLFPLVLGLGKVT